MKNKYVFFLISLLCLVIFLIIFGLTRPTLEKSKGTLIIGSNSIIDDNIVFFKKREKQYVQVPLLVVLKEIGCEVRFDSSRLVLITYKEKSFVLNFDDKLLSEDGNNNNLLIVPPGSDTYICVFTTNEVLIDDCTLKSLFFLMGVPYSIDIDYSAHKIVLSCLEQGSN